jgi:anaphase-promoting complex subunit 3
MVAYPESARAFERARRVDPTRLESCEVYSTVLWHLKRDTRLSHLAQECVSCDRLAPQTWCALGNCFSLQKEHETALRFFRRALQLDPKFAYAHTLCGHEYFANEDFEKAMMSYRAAIRLDPRHYNAWYGLGAVYYRQEKYELSEYHFRHALGINSRSSVLFCYLGMAQHALKRTGDALELLQKAVSLDAKNPLAKYEKASVLLSDDRFQEALEELEELKTVAPREASVFFLMGRIYKKLGLADQAMVNFSVALDLKPASADVNLIKSAIEKLHVPDDSEDEDL